MQSSRAKTLFSCVWSTVIGFTFVSARLHAEGPIAGLGPIGEVVKHPGTYQFTEGPAFDGSRWLYFSDIPANRIMRLDTTQNGATPEVFVEPSGMCNGLMIDGEGKLLGCRMEPVSWSLLM